MQDSKDAYIDFQVIASMFGPTIYDLKYVLFGLATFRPVHWKTPLIKPSTFLVYKRQIQQTARLI